RGDGHARERGRERAGARGHSRAGRARRRDRRPDGAQHGHHRRLHRERRPRGLLPRGGGRARVHGADEPAQHPRRRLLQGPVRDRAAAGRAHHLGALRQARARGLCEVQAAGVALCARGRVRERRPGRRARGRHRRARLRLPGEGAGSRARQALRTRVAGRDRAAQRRHERGPARQRAVPRGDGGRDGPARRGRRDRTLMSSPPPASPQALLPGSIDEVVAALAAQRYLCDRRLATALFLSLRMGRPLFLEGEPGVGKTELAKVLAAALDTKLLRLQCYEGLDVAQTAYEWNVARQMLEIRIAEAGHQGSGELLASLYRRELLIERPLLSALTQERSPVLLIDELDRADEPFEAFLLEVLGESQISIPELGTVRASAPPIVVITSNRTREIHDALKRRC